MDAISYDKELKIAAVGPSAWAKLGPERWFKNYTIVCANSRGYKAPFVIDLGHHRGEKADFTTESTIETPAFQALMQEELRDYKFLVYKPMANQYGPEQSRLIANPSTFSRFENKRIFRELFADKLPIIAHEFVSFSELSASTAGENYARFSKKLGPNLVLQDELGSGGRGTYFVHSADDMRNASQAFAAHRKGSICVISRLVDGIERSIQVCLTPDGLLPGPLQQQLARNTELVSVESRGGMFFCGGRLVHDDPEEVKQQVAEVIHIVAEKLRGAGYRGIFGVDFLVDSSNKLHVLEINARTTGLLPLLNEQESEVPLYLVHILECMGEKYQLELRNSSSPSSAVDGPASFIVLFNTSDGPAYFDSEIVTGNYRVTKNGLVRLNGQPRWHADADIMLQPFCTPDLPARPDLKLCNIFLRDVAFSDGGVLTPAARKLVTLLKMHILRTEGGGLN